MSVEATINVEGAEGFAEALNHLDTEMQEQVHQRLAEWAETVKFEAIRQVPVRTGYLRSTIYAKTSEWQTDIGAEAVYAASVEFGTNHSRAKPFIQPALEQNLPRLETMILEAVDLAKSEASF